MKKDRDFTYSEGLQIQLRQLSEWKGILNSNCYSALKKEARRQNKISSTAKNPRRGNTNAGCMVWRGKDMNSFIVNWKPKNYT